MSGVYDELSHLISLHAQQQMGNDVPFAIGHVVAYDPTSNEVQVVFPSFPVIDPISGALTGAYAVSPWVQLQSPWVGNGWGFQTAPEVGDSTPPFSGTQCAVFQLPRGSVAGLAAALLYTQNAVPPDSTLVAGEAILKHKSGTYIKFMDAGDLTVYAASAINMTNEVGITVSVEASGSIAITLPGGGTFSINGTSDALALVSKLVSAFNAHTHPDPQGGSTGVPTSPWSASTVESSIAKVGS
jgi:hypothetical protein